MTVLNYLPNEILLEIVKCLCDRKIHHFDTVGTKDLQHVRLVSKRLLNLATPLLFENMVLDEKLLGDEDLTGISQFMRRNPHLAWHVRRVQRKLSPLFTNAVDLATRYFTHIVFMGLDMDSIVESDNEVRLIQALTLRLVLDEKGNPIQYSVLMPDCCFRSRTSFLDTVAVLPNLIHVENTVSTGWPSHLRALARQFSAETEFLIESIMDNSIVPLNNLAHAYEHLSDLVTPSVKSLKLRDMPLAMSSLGDWSRGLESITHLDVECSLSLKPYTNLIEKEPSHMHSHATKWRSQLQNLTNLRTLRLSSTGAWDDVYAMAKLGLDYDAQSVNLDDLFEGVTLPYLTSLSLINWPVKEDALANIIRQHRQNLKTLELHRISLDISTCGGHEKYTDKCWRSIAKACGDCSSIQRFSFRRLKTHVFYFDDFFDFDDMLHEDVDDEMIRSMYRIARGW